MCTGLEIAAAIGTAATAAKGIAGAFKKPKAPPAPQTPAAPTGPATQPDVTSFTRPAAGSPPGFLGPGLAGLTPIQQRTKSATLGTSGSDSRFRDPEALSFYKNLLFRDVVGDDGAVIPGASITPIEKQFLKQGFGQTPQADTPESFLSALLRT